MLACDPLLTILAPPLLPTLPLPPYPRSQHNLFKSVRCLKLFPLTRPFPSLLSSLFMWVINTWSIPMSPPGRQCGGNSGRPASCRYNGKFDLSDVCCRWSAAAAAKLWDRSLLMSASSILCLSLFLPISDSLSLSLSLSPCTKCINSPNWPIWRLSSGMIVRWVLIQSSHAFYLGMRLCDADHPWISQVQG